MNVGLETKHREKPYNTKTTNYKIAIDFLVFRRFRAL